MSDFLDAQIIKLKQALELKIDFVGQERAEILSRQILWSSAAIAFLVGLIAQSLTLLFSIFSLGFSTCCVVILPAWKPYNSHPVNWLPELNEYGHPLSASSTEKQLGAVDVDQEVVLVESKKKR